MKAMVLHEPRPIEENPLKLEEVPDPEPQQGQIRIKIKACGVCHTDLHIAEGELPPRKKSLIPGHQIVGTVDKLGAHVTNFRIGDRVGVPWLNWTDRTCRYCLKGLENMCESIRFTGYDVDGGYAEYFAISQDFAYKLPDGYDDYQVAPLLCAGIIGFRALRLSEVKKGEILGLYGFGASAHIVLQIAQYWGCEVYVFTRSQNHRWLAEELGAAWVGGAQDTPPQKIDRAILFAPAGELVVDALRVMDKGGTLAIACVYLSPIPELDYNKYLFDERKVRSVTASTRENARDLLEIAPKVPVRTEIETFPLKDANRVLQMLKRSEIKGAAVLEIE
jgi:propanol-preferring alcohol dehydrogenase